MNSLPLPLPSLSLFLLYARRDTEFKLRGKIVPSLRFDPCARIMLIEDVYSNARYFSMTSERIEIVNVDEESEGKV